VKSSAIISFSQRISESVEISRTVRISGLRWEIGIVGSTLNS
jgi:hypothetical protein